MNRIIAFTIAMIAFIAPSCSTDEINSIDSDNRVTESTMSDDPDKSSFYIMKFDIDNTNSKSFGFEVNTAVFKGAKSISAVGRNMFVITDSFHNNIKIIRFKNGKTSIERVVEFDNFRVGECYVYGEQLIITHHHLNQVMITDMTFKQREVLQVGEYTTAEKCLLSFGAENLTIFSERFWKTETNKAFSLSEREQFEIDQSEHENLLNTSVSNKNKELMEAIRKRKDWSEIEPYIKDALITTNNKRADYHALLSYDSHNQKYIIVILKQ